jgi:hypothetical protein
MLIVVLNWLSCVGYILVSVVGSAFLVLLMHGCSRAAGF